MSAVPQDLINLLPAVHQIRDAQQQHALRQLLGVVGEQVQAIHADIDRLYDNWFIETCDDWVVPYIAELVGFRKVDDPGEPGDGLPTGDAAINRFAFPRREVANTVRLRRRKGTLSVLEDLAANVAGWSARAVEFGRQILTTPDERFPEFSGGTTVNFADGEAIERIGTPFSAIAHTPDFRSIGSQSGVGWYGPSHVGLFVWTRQVFPITRGEPRCLPIQGVENLLFAIHPLGVNSPLYAKATPETDELGIAVETNLPVALTRDMLATASGLADPRFYGSGKSVVIEEVREAANAPTFVPIPSDRVFILDLSQLGNCNSAIYGFWNAIIRLVRSLSHSDESPTPNDTKQRTFAVAECDTVPAILKAIQKLLSVDQPCVILDPETGRMIVPQELAYRIKVTCHTALTSAIGGGEYERPYVLPDAAAHPRARVAGPWQEPADGRQVSLRELLQNRQSTGRCRASADRFTALIDPQDDRLLQDCGVEFASSLTWRLHQPQPLIVAAGATLELRARRQTRPVVQLNGSPTGCGRSAWTIHLQPGARLVLDGLLLTGSPLHIVFDDPPTEPATPQPAAEECNAAVEAANADADPQPLAPPARVHIRHCTLMPLQSGCHCDDDAPAALRLQGSRGTLLIEQSLIGGIETQVHDTVLPAASSVLVPSLQMRDSILDSGGRCNALASDLGCCAQVQLTIRRCTVLGRVLVRRLDAADDCLFGGIVSVRDRQHGSIRYSYVPRTAEESLPCTCGCGSVDLKVLAARAVHNAVHSSTPRRFRCQPDLAEGLSPDYQATAPMLRPRFHSSDYGHPGYCQLRRGGAREIMQGAESESQMGVFHNEYLPQRWSRLAQQLADFTPADMESALIDAEGL